MGFAASRSSAGSLEPGARAGTGVQVHGGASFWTQCKEALFGVLFLAAKDSHVTNTGTVVLLTITTAQLCSFAVAGLLAAAAAEDGQTYSGMRELSGILDSIKVGSIVGALQLSASLLQVLLWLSVAFSAGSTALLASVAITLVRGRRQAGWQLKLMRTVALLGSTVLFIPIVSLQLGWVACAQPAVHGAIGGPAQCFVGGHLAGMVLCLLTLPPFICTAGATAACYVDHSLRGSRFNAKLHGRADAVLLIGQVLTIAVFDLLPASSALWLKVILLLALSAYWLRSFIVTQPHIQGTMNDIRAAQAGAFTWCSISLTIAVLYPRGDAGLLLLGGVLPVSVLAATAARMRRSRVEMARFSDLLSMADMHRWGLARARQYVALQTSQEQAEALFGLLGELRLLPAQSESLQQDMKPMPNLHRSTPSSTLQLTPKAPVKGVAGRGADPEHVPRAKIVSHGHMMLDDSKSAAPASRPPRMTPSHSSITRTSSLDSSAGQPEREISLSHTGLDTVLEVGGSSGAHSPAKQPSRQPQAALASAHPVVSNTGIAARVVATEGPTHRTPLERALLTAADRAFKTAAAVAGASTLAHFTKASFYRYYRSSRYIEYVALNDAKAGGPPLDVAFFVYQRTRQLQEAQAGFSSVGEAKLSAIDRVLYDQHWTAAVKAEVDWHTAQVRVWSVLAAPDPSAEELHLAGIQLTRALITAQTSYDAMLAMNPNSSRLLRAMGSYRIRMCGDVDAGNALLSRAERMDAAAFQRSQAELPFFQYGAHMPTKSFVVDESCALITASGSPHSIGEVTDANATAARMFACTVPTLISKALPDLLPPILGEAFEASMLQYTTSGTGLTFDKVRLMLMEDASQHLLPVAGLLQETPSVDTSMNMNFTLALQKVNTPFDMLLCAGPDNDYRIVSATASARSTLDVTDSFGEGEGGAVSLLRYMPQLDERAAEALFGSDSVEEVVALVHASASPRARKAGTGAGHATQGVALRRTGSTASMRTAAALQGAPHQKGGGPLVLTDMMRACPVPLATVPVQTQAITGGVAPLLLVLWPRAGVKRLLPTSARPAVEGMVNKAPMSTPTHGQLVSLPVHSRTGDPALHRGGAIPLTPLGVPTSHTGPDLGAGPSPSPAMSRGVADVRSQDGDSAGADSKAGEPASPHLPEVPRAFPPGSTFTGEPRHSQAPATYPPLHGKPGMGSPERHPTAKLEAEGGSARSGKLKGILVSGRDVSEGGRASAASARDGGDDMTDGGGSVRFQRLAMDIMAGKGRAGPGSYQGSFRGGGNSSASSGSMTSHTRRTRYLLRSVLGQGRHPAVTAIVTSLALLFGTLLLLAIVFCVALLTERDTSERSEASLTTGFARTAHMLAGASGVQHLLLNHHGSYPLLGSELSYYTVQHSASELEADHAQLTADHRLLYNKGGKAEVDGEVTTILDRTASGQDVGINLTVPEATQWFAGLLRNVADLPPSSITPTEPHVAAVVHNALLVLLPALDANSQNKLRVYLNHEHEQDVLLLGTFISLFLVFVVGSSVFLWWQTSTLRAHRVKLLDTFQFVSRKASKKLKRLAQTALLTSVSAAQVELGGVDDELMELVGEGLMDDERGADGAGEGAVEAGLHSTTRIRERHVTSSDRDPLKHSVQQDVVAGVRLWLPVLFLGGYLAGLFVINDSFRIQRKQVAQGSFFRQTLLIGLLRMDMTFAAELYDPIRALQLSSSATDDALKVRFDDAHALAHEELSIVIRGTAHGPIDGVSTSGPLPDSRAFDLMLGDACEFIEAEYAVHSTNGSFLNPDACRQLDKGILRSGLQAGVLRYLSLASRAFAQVYEARKSGGGTLPGNYSNSDAVLGASQAAQLLTPYLSRLASLSTTQARDEVHALMSQEIAVIFGLSAAVVVLLLASLLTLFIPHAYQHGEQTVATQILLTVLPPSLVGVNIDLHEAVVEAVEMVEQAFPDTGVMSNAHKYMLGA